ncbi:23S rRNA (adenine(2030)-N(6))-methyltransferase RlmJ [Marinobacter sp. X15-166B]|uniref:23S rRNA (adenine(2030)-N(6))-methyltransferase RlmJ n=1 Tax=Marinobacter sp. X15-166B TaxID=1897620 RepID=UPI00085BF821|nr:23S rRNA (adenine(2030)-N(6))-methyltransferase RlmJ [Marinobacter sp. X15-166B]OEY65286.1 hypothetical protein BG841_01630 [Marinobacter sp. X15-166B]
MLSYLHAFHAGNFADVQKHAALTLILQMLHAKNSAIACFDTHAGSAIYDLASERARKTAEADGGIQRIWAKRNQLSSADWSAMLGYLERKNTGRQLLARYPGSPAWLAELARPQDSVTAYELHPSEGNLLAQWGRRQGVTVRCEDGLKGLLKALPPKAPRLLALIDPSYEVKSEYQQVAQTLVNAWRKCRHGTFLIWYPILPAAQHEALFDGLRASPVRKVLRHELRLQQAPERGMQGSGVLVVNPPWGFAERFEHMLAEVVAPDCLDARTSGDWLIPE